MQVPGLSYYNFRMRSKLLALLIALLPLQLCWAAVAPYIHEDARGAAHIAGVHGLEIMQSQEGPLDVSPALQIGLDSSGVSEFLCKRFGLQLTEMRSPN